MTSLTPRPSDSSLDIYHGSQTSTFSQKDSVGSSAELTPIDSLGAYRGEETQNGAPGSLTLSEPDWTPFWVLPLGQRMPRTRSMETFEGVGDRIRIAAFAELQAVHGFRYGAAKFQDAPKSLRSEWLGLALAEERHLGWLTTRAKELGVRLDERPVSEDLWRSLVGCRSAEEFAWYMSHAEERGRLAGERFSVALAVVDPESASIFRRIAEEEVAHVELASRYFPNSRWSTEARTLMRQKVMGQ